MQEDLLEAVRYHEQGQMEEAARLYQLVLARHPDQPDALHLLGVIALQQGDFQEAIERIGRAIGLNPGVAPYYCNLAEAYRMSGQLDRAVACCKMALRLQPDYPEAHNNFGMALLTQNKASEA